MSKFMTNLPKFDVSLPHSITKMNTENVCVCVRVCLPHKTQANQLLGLNVFVKKAMLDRTTSFRNEECDMDNTKIGRKNQAVELGSHCDSAIIKLAVLFSSQRYVHSRLRYDSVWVKRTPSLFRAKICRLRFWQEQEYSHVAQATKLAT